MRLLRAEISVKNFGANAHKFYFIHFLLCTVHDKMYTTLQYLVLFVVRLNRRLFLYQLLLQAIQFLGKQEKLG
jgi:hypothetical protein